MQRAVVVWVAVRFDTRACQQLGDGAAICKGFAQLLGLFAGGCEELVDVDGFGRAEARLVRLVVRGDFFLAEGGLCRCFCLGELLQNESFPLALAPLGEFGLFTPSAPQGCRGHQIGWQERGAGQRDDLGAVLQRAPEADRAQVVEVFAQGNRSAVKAVERKRGERVGEIRLG